MGSGFLFGLLGDVADGRGLLAIWHEFYEKWHKCGWKWHKLGHKWHEFSDKWHKFYRKRNKLVENTPN